MRKRLSRWLCLGVMLSCGSCATVTSERVLESTQRHLVAAESERACGMAEITQVGSSFTVQRACTCVPMEAVEVRRHYLVRREVKGLGPLPMAGLGVLSLGVAALCAAPCVGEGDCDLYRAAEPDDARQYGGGVYLLLGALVLAKGVVDLAVAADGAVRSVDTRQRTRTVERQVTGPAYACGEVPAPDLLLTARSAAGQVRVLGLSDAEGQVVVEGQNLVWLLGQREAVMIRSGEGGELAFRSPLAPGLRPLWRWMASRSLGAPALPVRAEVGLER